MRLSDVSGIAEESAADNLPITRWLEAWEKGDPDSLDYLMPAVFSELRRIAWHHLNKEQAGHTLQPTALVSELFLRLVELRRVQWKNRAQFFGVAAEMMRRILVDYARGRKTQKRGGGVRPVALDERLCVSSNRDEVDLLALDEALDLLETVDSRQRRIVTLRFFGGLNNQEIADLLKVSRTTVKREWRIARLWLYRQMRSS